MQADSVFRSILSVLSILLICACSHSDQSGSMPSESGLNDISIVDNPFLLEKSQLAALPAALAAIPDLMGETSRVSIGDVDQEADANSINASVSADGRFVVFDTIATNLVANDNNTAWDIYLRDRLDGTTTRISTTPTGDDSDGASIDPVISDDGTSIVFSSSATNLVSNDSNSVADIFRFDMLTGELTRISTGINSGEANDDSDAPDVSATGRYIVYESNANNLVAEPDTNGVTDIYFYDTQTGVTELISINSDEQQGNGISRNPSISDDGRFVAFESHSDNLVGNDTNGVVDIFLRDRLNGETVRVNVSNENMETNNDSVTPVISGNGSVVAFRSIANNLVAGDTNDVRDIFIRDLTTNTTSRVSISTTGQESNGTSFSSPDIDANGRYIVFYSAADNLVEGDDNAAWDVFLHDRELNETVRVSVNSDGEQANASSFVPAISAGGQYVVFGSGATNLATQDNNQSWDIFTHIAIQPNRAPIANAGDDAEMFMGVSLELNGSGSTDPDGDTQILNYSWSIESAPPGSMATITPSDAVVATFIPDIQGEYIISLTVNDGELDSIADEVLISVVENLAPTAMIETSVQSGDVPLTVDFNGSSSSDPEGATLLYHWDFSDPDSLQATSTSVSDAHIFTQPGQYEVVLTVTDDFGKTGQSIVIINATAPNMPPVVQPTASPATGSVPLIVEFNSNAQDVDNDILNYLWDFGDGASSTESDPVHEYTQEGRFDVTLKVNDGTFEVQETIQVIVGTSLDVKVMHARLEIRQKNSFKDKIQIKARINTNTTIFPGANDRFQISVNQNVLIDLPIDAFAPYDGGKLLIYSEKHKYVKINLEKNYIKYSEHKANFSNIDVNEPVIVKFEWRSQASSEVIEFIQFVDGHCRKEYERNHGHHFGDQNFGEHNFSGHSKVNHHADGYSSKMCDTKEIYFYRAFRDYPHRNNHHGFTGNIESVGRHDEHGQDDDD